MITNIKELIGQRIQAARKAKGLTQAELATLAGDLKQPRINNWEKGIRTPGPVEIKMLAATLEVSPAYLMGLSDESDGLSATQEMTTHFIPVLNYEQASDPRSIIKAAQEQGEGLSYTPVSQQIAKIAGEFAFTMQMYDDSMAPELTVNDWLIISPDFKLKPGSLVLAKIEGTGEIVIRRYKQITTGSSMDEFELLAQNSHWPVIRSSESMSCKILGTAIYMQRPLINL